VRCGFERLPPPCGWPNCPYIRVHNTWADHRAENAGDANRVAWKYYIFVQNEYGSIGAIDPDIENDANPA
jgi:hypothetical protein